MNVARKWYRTMLGGCEGKKGREGTSGQVPEDSPNQMRWSKEKPAVEHTLHTKVKVAFLC